MADFMNTMTATMRASDPWEGLRTVGPSHKGSNSELFSGMSSVVGGLADLRRGSAEQQIANQQAAQYDSEASQEELAGRNNVIANLDQMNANMAQIIAAGGASGIAGQGSLFSSINDVEKQGGENESSIRFNTKLKSSGLRGQAEQTRAEGKFAKAEGYGRLAGRAMDYFSRSRRRG